MNYLILTPDGVGSTILQRILTMCLYLEGEKVTNTHEITNGLKLKKGLAIKDFDLEYTQNLREITDILKQSSKDTIMVSRLAKYHLDARNDVEWMQKDFYEFLNNFYDKIIVCVRNNIFEYAMSWSIRKKSGVINVYDKTDRKNVSAVSKVDESYFIEKCQDYVKYQNWVETNFPNVQQISYEDMLMQGDNVMEDLTGWKHTFKRKFGVPLKKIIRKEYDYYNYKTKEGYGNDLSNLEAKSLVRYRRTGFEMMKKNIIMRMPMKNTTLSDKQTQIKNFGSCLDKFYTFAKNHNWIDQSKATYDFWNEKHIYVKNT